MTESELLLQYLPQPIRSERDYRRALAQLEKLMIPRPGPARSRLIEMLSVLIENYESSACPVPSCSPSRLFAHLVESRGVNCADVAREAGISPATLSSVLANRRGISKANARKLARYFKVSPLAFLGGEDDE
jgi:antitoxin component HigA of HigAB toxin-antitoxin module